MLGGRHTRRQLGEQEAQGSVMPTREHHCHAVGCSRACKPEFLMCRSHWAFVPDVIQRAVYKFYRPGQCDDMNPSENWHRAADAAIGAVAVLEGKPVCTAY